VQRKVKNRRPDVLPLTGRAQSIVQHLWDARTFGTPLFDLDGAPLGELCRACEAAGVPFGRKVAGGFVFHDTPRCALTNTESRHARRSRAGSLATCPRSPCPA